MTMLALAPVVTADPGCLQVGLAACDSAGSHVVAAVTAVVDFVNDPLGYLAAAVQGAAVWVMGQLSLFANHSTQPDLTASWWVDTYRKGFAIATVLLGFALLLEILQVARRKASVDDLMETLSIWIPAWFAGVLFGPALAQFVINGSGFLADGIIHGLTGFSGGDAFKAISDAAGNTGIGSGAIGAAQAFMSLFVGLGVLLASVMVYVSLCVQAVIIYLATAVFSIGWVWIVTQRHRADAWRIPRMFLGIVFSKALLFLLLGVCLAIASSATAIQGDGVGRDFALVVMAIIGLLFVAFAPLMLLKHAPVMPGTSSSREADGVTGAGAARAGRDGGTAVRGARFAGKAGGKLSALAAARKGRRSSPPAPGAPSGPGRTIDAPIPPSGTSRAGTGSTTSPGGGARTTGTPRPGRPNPASMPDGAMPSAPPPAPRAATPNGGRRGGSAVPAAGSPGRSPATRSARRPAGRQPRAPQASADNAYGSTARQPRQTTDPDYSPSTRPAEESSV